MPSRHPVQVLMDEHQIILKVLDAFEERVARLRQEPFPSEFFSEALDFFRNFADGCHHFKEEETLFPALVAKGFSRETGPVGVMLNEHEFGRACLKAVRENLADAGAGSAPAAETIRENSLRYIEMLRRHIYKEDNILFRMAVKALADDDITRLDSAFSDESNPRIDAAVREKYSQLAARLTREAVPA
jgi:hemerythrin-like domain-containing protein